MKTTAMNETINVNFTAAERKWRTAGWYALEIGKPRQMAVYIEDQLPDHITAADIDGIELPEQFLIIKRNNNPPEFNGIKVIGSYEIRWNNASTEIVPMRKTVKKWLKNRRK